VDDVVQSVPTGAITAPEASFDHAEPLVPCLNLGQMAQPFL
jgi:hypothetical protein